MFPGESNLLAYSAGGQALLLLPFALVTRLSYHEAYQDDTGLTKVLNIKH